MTLHRTVCGIGFIGSGQYDPGLHKDAYVKWRSMLLRGHCAETKAAQPTYDDCFVDEVWHNFQTFAVWFYSQPHYAVKIMEIDKDLIKFGNRRYGPDVCCLVPRHVNRLLTDSRSTRNDLGMNIKQQGPTGGFQVLVSFFGRREFHGNYPNLDQARRIAACVKADAIRKTAHYYAGLLPTYVLTKLLNLAWSDLYQQEPKK